jgi:hypothetical protein
MTKYTTRESWLLAAVDLLRPIFLEKNHVIPADVMVSCGFASTGTRSHHVGQCWSKRSSANEQNQIFISPALHEPIEVLDTLVHELVHAVDDCQHHVGAGYFDDVTTVIQGGSSSVKALTGSTEEEQFH